MRYRWFTDDPRLFSEIVKTPPCPVFFAELQFITNGGMGSCELQRHHDSELYLPSRTWFENPVAERVFSEKINRYVTTLHSWEEYKGFMKNTLPLLSVAGYTPQIGMLAFRVRKECAEETLHFMQQGETGKVSYYTQNRPDIDAIVMRGLQEYVRTGKLTDALGETA
jgi:hypothetical protein